jgi:LacI family transcriptional regulator
MKATIEVIAKKANVSQMTVSRVFSGKSKVSEEKQKLIKKIASQMDYYPNLIARSLSARKAMTIGIFMPKTKNAFLDIYISQILSGITDVVQNFDYRIMFFPFDYTLLQENLYTSVAKSNLIDGMILLKTRINDKGLDKLAKSDFPFVLVNHKKYSSKYNFVDSHNEEGAKLAIEYFYRLGHRNIAFVAGLMKETNAIDRLKGYRETLKNLGLTYRKEWVVYGEFNKEKAYEKSKSLLQTKPLPTAIFCSDDYMAIGVMNRIKEEGLIVPRDISIIGFDDIELSSYVKPPLTTVRQPIYEIGKKSAEMLLSLIDGKAKAPLYELLAVELVVRKSVQKIKN